jgi:hypothetical protein
MKQSDLKLMKGGGHEPSPPSPSSNGTSLWEYAALFAVSGVIWLVIGYWIDQHLTGSD